MLYDNGACTADELYGQPVFSVSAWTLSATVLVIHLAFHAWNPTREKRAGGRAGRQHTHLTEPSQPSAERRWQSGNNRSTKAG